MQVDVVRTNKMRWGAIWGGVIASVMIGALFNWAGIGIGMVSVAPEASSVVFLSKAAILWSILGVLIAMFSGGWISGRFSDAVSDEKMSGAVHGFLAASLTTLLLVFLTTVFPAMILSDVIEAVSRSGSHLRIEPSKLIKETLAMNPDLKHAVDEAVSKAKESIASISPQKKEEIKQELQEKIKMLISADSEEDFQSKRDELIDFVSSTLNIDRKQVENKLENIENAYQQLQEKAKQYAAQTANKLGKVILLGFLVALLGVVSGAIGGMVGKKTFEDQRRYL